MLLDPRSCLAETLASFEHGIQQTETQQFFRIVVRTCWDAGSGSKIHLIFQPPSLHVGSKVSGMCDSAIRPAMRAIRPCPPCCSHTASATPLQYAELDQIPHSSTGCCYSPEFLPQHATIVCGAWQPHRTYTGSIWHLPLLCWQGFGPGLVIVQVGGLDLTRSGVSTSRHNV